MTFYCSIRISHVLMHFFQKEDNLFRKYKTQSDQNKHDPGHILTGHTYRCYLAFVKSQRRQYPVTQPQQQHTNPRCTSHSEGQRLSVGGWKCNQRGAELGTRQPWKLSGTAGERGCRHGQPGQLGTPSKPSEQVLHRHWDWLSCHSSVIQRQFLNLSATEMLRLPNLRFVLFCFSSSDLSGGYIFSWPPLRPAMSRDRKYLDKSNTELMIYIRLLSDGKRSFKKKFLYDTKINQ